MRVRNVIELSRGEEAQRFRVRKAIDTIVVHRIGATIGTNGTDISKRFREDPNVGKYTGMQVPYHFVVDRWGKVDQCLTLTETGYHARTKWNRRSIAVACVGDFRTDQIPVDQWWGCIDICALMAEWVGANRYEIRGHTELPGSSKPGKDCPGKYFPLDELRTEIGRGVEPMLREEAIDKDMATAGITISAASPMNA